MRLHVTAAALVAAAALAVPATAETPVKYRAGAKGVLAAYLQPLIEAPGRQARVRVGRCRPPAGQWATCRAWASGTTRCRMILRVRRNDGGWSAYVRRMRCSS